jgi:hypothetical protein
MNISTLLSDKLPGIEFLMDQMPGYSILKDLSSVYIKGCSKVAALLSLKDGNDLLGLTDHPRFCS